MPYFSRLIKLDLLPRALKLSRCPNVMACIPLPVVKQKILSSLIFLLVWLRVRLRQEHHAGLSVLQNINSSCGLRKSLEQQQFMLEQTSVARLSPTRCRF